MPIEKPDIVVKESLRTTDVPIANKVTAGDINELKRSIDDTIDVVNGTPSGTDYWKVYHVNQGIATDDSGDGTRENPFYTVHAALEKMNEEKAVLGISPGEISDCLTKIVVWGTKTASGASAAHYESLLITRQKYVQWHIVAEASMLASRFVLWRPGYSGESRVSNVENYNDWCLPPLMITNMTESDFTNNFLKYCWDTRDTETGHKALNNGITYDSLYGENPFGPDPYSTVTSAAALGIGYELGPWQGGTLLGETFYDEILGTGRHNTYFVGCKLKGFLLGFNNSALPFLVATNGFARGTGCFIIGGRNNSAETGTISLEYTRFEECSGIYFKNTKNAAFSNMLRFNTSQTIFENAAEDSPYPVEFGSSGYPSYSRFILKPRNASIEGGGSDIATLHIGGAEFQNLLIEGDTTGYSTDKIGLPNSVNITGLFAVTGKTFINKQTTSSSPLLIHVNHTIITCMNAYIATSDVVNLQSLSARNLCKSNTGILSITEAKIGSFHVKQLSPTLPQGSGILFVNGTLNINSLSCYGDVLMRTGTTANLSGIIEGNLVVAAGATLNAVSLTVKGNVTFEAGATVTWKGGTYTGTLTDPDNHFGGALSGAYLNV